MRRLLIPLLVVLIGAVTLWQQQAGNAPLDGTRAEDRVQDTDADGRGSRLDLPAEAIATIRLILQGGPFPYRQDGKTFGNREGLLPNEAGGHYREYTVPTPGSPDRGARRIVTGGSPPSTWYYTDDHYRSFRSFEPDEESLP